MIPKEKIAEQIPHCLTGTNFPTLGKKYEGKVRDNYTQGEKRILIATDRLSAFDRIITTIPFKGQILNQITQFWFEKTRDIVENHALKFPDPNVTIAKECEPLPIEMVVRGYLTGVTTTSVWYHYERGGRNFCGNVLPDGMTKNQKFERPIITPSTKAEKGGHDESVSAAEIVNRGLLTKDQMDELSEIALKLFARGTEICAKQGIILVDTKYEFGLLDGKDGKIILIDEVHTPDSSRFWFQDSSRDKEYLREWLAAKGFLGEGAMPEIPNDIRIETSRRYMEAYELITGLAFDAEVGNVSKRIERNLESYFASTTPAMSH